MIRFHKKNNHPLRIASLNLFFQVIIAMKQLEKDLLQNFLNEKNELTVRIK